MRTNYQVVLPPSEMPRLQKIVRDDAYPQAKVDQFVNGLARKQMKFYDDTTATLLESDACVKWTIPDPSGAKAPVTLWQCASCKYPSTYQGIERGHKTDWKLELKKAGVKDLNEATIVYNNLLNLQVECSTCNAGHAFEKDEDGHFKDVPAKDDFRQTVAGKQQYQDLIDSYEGMDLDSYDLTDPFIDNSSYQPETLVLMYEIILTDDGGLNSGVSKFFGQTLVRITNEKRGKWIKVQLVQTWDNRLKSLENRYMWTLARKLKAGVVKTY
jgi:hypothetical protein